jgi:hypothetical protein
MPYTTRCTCSDQHLALIGCDCRNDGPERTVLTYAEEDAQRIAEHEAAWLKQEQDRTNAEAAYHEAQFAKLHDGAAFTDAPEDFADYTLKAARHQ